ncbi:hypothetical protein HOC11_08490 [archaeon]|nr:hypothetical protein [archaeon]
MKKEFLVSLLIMVMLFISSCGEGVSEVAETIVDTAADLSLSGDITCYKCSIEGDGSREETEWLVDSDWRDKIEGEILARKKPTELPTTYIILGKDVCQWQSTNGLREYVDNIPGWFIYESLTGGNVFSNRRRRDEATDTACKAYEPTSSKVICEFDQTNGVVATVSLSVGGYPAALFNNGEGEVSDLNLFAIKLNTNCDWFTEYKVQDKLVEKCKEGLLGENFEKGATVPDWAIAMAGGSQLMNPGDVETFLPGEEYKENTQQNICTDNLNLVGDYSVIDCPGANIEVTNDNGALFRYFPSLGDHLRSRATSVAKGKVLKCLGAITCPGTNPACSKDGVDKNWYCLEHLNDVPESEKQYAPYYGWISSSLVWVYVASGIPSEDAPKVS